MGEGQKGGLKLRFDGHLRLEFRGAKVTSDAGLLAVRELDDALGLAEKAGEMICDNRTGKKSRQYLPIHHLAVVTPRVCLALEDAPSVCPRPLVA